MVAKLELRVLLLALLGLAGCSKEVTSSDKLIHLELSLADGSSPARALQSREVEWVERLEISGPDTDWGTWSAHFCRLDPVPDGGPGIALRGNVPEEDRSKRVELRSSAKFQAEKIDFLELELGRTTSGTASVSWRSSLDLEGRLLPHSATALVHLAHAPAKIRIALSDLPGWAGEIRELTVAPKQEGQQRFDLVALRLGSTGFSPGPDPLEDGGDGGLIALGREARRAWPCDWNVPLFASLVVPRGGRLCVNAGTNTQSTRVGCAVDARLQPGGDWVRIAEAAFEPGARAQAPAWERISASLKPFEGREIQLRFLADASDAPRDNGRLEHARIYWGEPLVFGAQPRERRPNVLLITIDTLRADALGVMRAEPGPSPTPFLDSLAQRGVLFEQSWSACNATSPSHASILTGLAVQDHGLHDNRSLLTPANTTLAERFRAGGWQTAAAVSVEHLTPGRSGLGQGFDRFWLGQQDAAEDGAKTVAAMKQWLSDFGREGERPTFLWLHLFDPHTPYDVPAQFLESFAARMGVAVPPKSATPPNLPANRWSVSGQFLADVSNREWAQFMYMACVAYADELVRDLFAELERQGLLEHTFVAVTADHGEALGEHDNWYHHTGLYREVMQVPLILVAPVGPRGVRVPEAVWSLDLAKTLFTIAGGETPPEVRGTDLMAFVARADRPQRRIFFEHSDLHQVGCTDQEHSAIYSVVDYLQLGPERKLPAGTLQLFDARVDPGQEHDLAEASTETGKRYRELLRHWRESALNRANLKGALSPEDQARLEQLGY